jgi:hypothetical protein
MRWMLVPQNASNNKADNIARASPVPARQASGALRRLTRAVMA